MKKNSNKDIIEVGIWKTFKIFPNFIYIYKSSNKNGEVIYTSNCGGNEKSVENLKAQLEAVYGLCEWTPYQNKKLSFGFLSFICLLCVLVNIGFHFLTKSSIGEAALMTLGTIFIVGYVIFRGD